MRGRWVATVAIGLVLAVLGAGCSLLGGGTYEIEATFRRTYNLFPGSPVRVLGIEVGKIKNLDIRPGDEAVTVTMVIDEGVELPADAAAIVIPEALLGERYVQIEPPYTGGDTLAAGGAIPLERTQVPFEFDEVLNNLNRFVEGLEPDEVGRLFTNLADVLDGQGETLGHTIDNASAAIAVLKDNDEELVGLASRLADLNETLSTRDRQLGAIIEDWNTVTGSLADDRQDIDAALSGLVRLTRDLNELMVDHRGDLQDDIETLTRVGRTANRNLDELSLAILSSAELFRHAERVVDRETHNWLPLVNHSGELGNELAETIANRIVGLCLGAGIDQETCEQIPFDELLGGGGGELCLPPVVPCEDDSTPSVADAIRSLAEAHPELGRALIDRHADAPPEGGDLPVDPGLPGPGLPDVDALRSANRREVAL